MSDELSEEVIGAVHLGAEGRLVEPGKSAMVPGVALNGAALANLGPHQVRKALGLAADHEERGRDVAGSQQVKDAGGGGRIGSVVEGQGDQGGRGR